MLQIAQKYLSDPVLFHRNDIDADVKFDVRYIVMLLSAEPLKVCRSTLGLWCIFMVSLCPDIGYLHTDKWKRISGHSQTIINTPDLTFTITELLWTATGCCVPALLDSICQRAIWSHPVGQQPETLHCQQLQWCLPLAGKSCNLDRFPVPNVKKSFVLHKINGYKFVLQGMFVRLGHNELVLLLQSKMSFTDVLPWLHL